MAQRLADPPRSHVVAQAMLPLLDTLVDPHLMRTRLGELAPRASGGDLVRVSARLIDYKEGQRGLIAYELEGPDGRRLRLLGKHFVDPVQAKRVREIHLALWSKVFRDVARLGVPKPLGWLPDLSLVLSLPVEGRPLDRTILAGEASRGLRRAAEWLAHLHGSRLRLDRRFDLDNELVNVGRWADLVGAADPEQASAAARIAEHLRAHAVRIRFEPGSPIHKDFHYGHVVVGDRLSVLDFDEMRHGDRNFDLAHFCTYLYLLCVRQGWPASRFRMLALAFLDEYARRSGWKRDDRFAYFSAYSCLKIARQLCLDVGVQPIPTRAERRRQLRAILERGRALASSLA